MISINNLFLRNFKSYKAEEFEFTGLTVFCGSNSVGKSTAIQALGIILQTNFTNSLNIKINGELVHIGNIDDIHNFSNRSEDEFYIEVAFSDFIGKWGYIDSEQRALLSGKNELSFIGEDTGLIKSKNFIYQYLEAERYGPRDNLPLAQHHHHEDWLGTKGEFTIEVLESLNSKRRVSLTGNMNDPRKHLNIPKDEVFQNIEAWMEEISPGHKLNPKREDRANATYNSIIPDHGKDTKPINIGFGYSYSLGIVTALLLSRPGTIVIVENPEAHLHPKGQSYLGRLIALTAQAGVQVIIETHSDHLINGIRVIARTKPDFDPSICTLYFISKKENETKAEKINLSKDGKLNNWPEGFFDQQVKDMYAIMTGQIELPFKGN